uniref:Proteolipid protein 2 n=1 Tax=Vombatus ursinus TaxID=29139 RepID=A0A4X2KQB9_VOMUR
MADSEHSPTPKCSAACTAFSRTRKGIFLLAEMVLCLLIIICYSASRVKGYLTLPVLEMVMAGVFFVIFMLNIHHQLQFINWPWSDFFRGLIASVLFFITSLITIIKNVDAQSMVGGVLGLVATILFAYDAYSTFQGQRSRHTPAATGECQCQCLGGLCRGLARSGFSSFSHPPPCRVSRWPLLAPLWPPWAPSLTKGG